MYEEMFLKFVHSREVLKLKLKKELLQNACFSSSSNCEVSSDFMLVASLKGKKWSKPNSIVMVALLKETWPYRF